MISSSTNATIGKWVSLVALGCSCLLVHGTARLTTRVIAAARAMWAHLQPNGGNVQIVSKWCWQRISLPMCATRQGHLRGSHAPWWHVLVVWVCPDGVCCGCRATWGPKHQANAPSCSSSTLHPHQLPIASLRRSKLQHYCLPQLSIVSCRLAQSSSQGSHVLTIMVW